MYVTIEIDVNVEYEITKEGTPEIIPPYDRPDDYDAGTPAEFRITHAYAGSVDILPQIEGTSAMDIITDAVSEEVNG